MSVLSVRNLNKAFGGVRAVNGVDLDADEGELVALIGPNGAGKSTCFNVINGQLRPDSGSIRLFERELVGMAPRDVWRLGVGRTFQVTATFPSMTVLENVQMALISHHRMLWRLLPLARSLYVDEAWALLELVGMADQAGRACGILAYGDIKRVELAVALANKPRLLLMDEPTAGMAPSERVGLMELTARIVGKQRISVLFTEHDMDVVFRHADRIVVLDRGSVVVVGSPETVRRDPDVQRIYLGTGATFSDGGNAPGANGPAEQAL